MYIITGKQLAVATAALVIVCCAIAATDDNGKADRGLASAIEKQFKQPSIRIQSRPIESGTFGSAFLTPVPTL